MNSPTTRHVLHIARFEVEMLLNEGTGEITMLWHPHVPRTAAQARRVLPQYESWRNAIVSAWSVRTGKATMITNNGADGIIRSYTLVEGEQITTCAPDTAHALLGGFDAVVIL